MNLERLEVVTKAVNSYPVGFEQELLQEINGLRESLRIFGGHAGGCWVDGPAICSCGFRKIWEEKQLDKAVRVERAENHREFTSGPGGV